MPPAQVGIADQYAPALAVCQGVNPRYCALKSFSVRELGYVIEASPIVRTRSVPLHILTFAFDRIR